MVNNQLLLIKKHHGIESIHMENEHESKQRNEKNLHRPGAVLLPHHTILSSYRFSACALDSLQFE